MLSSSDDIRSPSVSLSLHRFRYGYGSILHRGLDMEYQLHSRIVAVAVQTGQRVVGARASRLKVKARLAHLNHTVNRQIMWNISCGLADFLREGYPCLCLFAEFFFYVPR
ncbi:GPS domain-containing protein [Caerostris extrusa]|uniref:GPS domain-containing protein n=1 Tax=Caerostris extrusa TaxID=172846 RepID=A0AAV4NQM0_CAEEX|nr:GPS domain-containing protein [Caerostris extrusa]